jgi:hypothetical protein
VSYDGAGGAGGRQDSVGVVCGVQLEGGHGGDGRDEEKDTDGSWSACWLAAAW